MQSLTPKNSLFATHWSNPLDPLDPLDPLKS
jgi:hypothetical protein